MTDQTTPAPQSPAPAAAPQTSYEQYREAIPAALAAAPHAASAAPESAPEEPTPPPAPKHQPGPKPPFLVIGSSLYCQTEEGEKVLDLRLPIPMLEKFMEAQELEEQKIPRYIIDELLPPATGQMLLNMLDGAKAFAIVMTWAQEVGARLGASLGESRGSTGASEPTAQPSAPTSAPATT